MSSIVTWPNEVPSIVRGARGRFENILRFVTTQTAIVAISVRHFEMILGLQHPYPTLQLIERTTLYILETPTAKVQLYLDTLNGEQTLCQTNPHGDGEENLGEEERPPPVQVPRSVIPSLDVGREREEETPLQANSNTNRTRQSQAFA